jgi:hypothetical protein
MGDLDRRWPPRRRIEHGSRHLIASCATRDDVSTPSRRSATTFAVARHAMRPRFWPFDAFATTAIDGCSSESVGPIRSIQITESFIEPRFSDVIQNYFFTSIPARRAAFRRCQRIDAHASDHVDL